MSRLSLLLVAFLGFIVGQLFPFASAAPPSDASWTFDPDPEVEARWVYLQYLERRAEKCRKEIHALEVPKPARLRSVNEKIAKVDGQLEGYAMKMAKLRLRRDSAGPSSDHKR